MATTQPVESIPAHQLLVFLLQAGLLLLLAVVLGRLVRRLGIPAIVGELAIGVLLGPSVLGHIAPGPAGWLIPSQGAQFHLLDAVGQLGMLLLVGLTALELDFGLVRRQGATALRVSSAGLVVPLAFGVGAGLLLPRSLIPEHVQPVEFALFLGVALSVSAIPVIAKTLADLDLTHRDIGQLTLVAGALDDVAGWLLLSVVSAIATSGLHPEAVVRSLLWLVLVVAVAGLVGRPVVRAVLRRANRSGQPAFTVATVAVIILLCAAATQAMGMEAVFGAFVGGVLVGSCGEGNLAAVAPLRTTVLAVLAPLFFATAGLRMDLTSLARLPAASAAVVVLFVAIAGKFLGAFLGALGSRLNRWEALALGAGMNARGVIQVVVATVGLEVGVLTATTYTIVILVAIVTSLMAGPVLRFAMRRVEYTDEEVRRRHAHIALVGTSAAPVPTPGPRTGPPIPGRSDDRR